MSNTIDSAPLRQPHDPTQPPSAPPSLKDAVSALTQVHVSLDYGRVAANMVTASVQAHDAQVRSRLDAFRDAYSGPYMVAGQSIKAPCQFRMMGGYNDANAGLSRKQGPAVLDTKNPRVRELFAICARAHAPFPMHCLLGCPTAHEIVAVTQALIDAGKLPSAPGDVTSRIKTMQWTWGIGIDCTDYVMSAAMAANGKSYAAVWFETSEGVTLPQPGVDYFAECDVNPHLARTPITQAQPGDVFRLDSPGDVGHRAVVCSHSVLSAHAQADLAKKHGVLATIFIAQGPVHVFEMDASWSAGRYGAPWGGVRRDTWLYNESTKEWAQLDVRHDPPGPATFETTPSGPANDVFHGVYRFK